MILVFMWHTRRRVVLFVDRKTLIIKKEISLYLSPFDFLSRLSKKQLADAQALVVVFGMKHFSAVRQVTLLANLYAAIYRRPLYSLTVSEDSPWLEMKPKIKQALRGKGVSVISPQYMALPNITKKKK